MPLPKSKGELVHGREFLAALRELKRGEFGVRLPTDQTGIAGQLAETFNEVAELMEGSTNELERVSVAVGKEGRIRERLSVRGEGGGWINRTNAINTLIVDLVQPTEEISRVIGAVKQGDLTQRIALEQDGSPLKGEFLRIGKTVNTMVDQLGSFASEVTRVAREVGTEGKLGGQAQMKGVAGTWKDLTDSVNSMAGNLTAQVRNIAEVTTSVAKGDLSKKITVDVKGEILELKNTINTMVDQLNSFASEVTRVAREVGTEGILGGQADVKGVGGTWKDLTDSVNSMAGNLTAQVRNIAEVTTAVANGDLRKKVTADVRGEILALKNTINSMVDQLNSFASEVTRVAREVGTEGILGGQADVKGVGGTWKDLTDSVNSMASNLTAQVRNIAQVTTAVANGDLRKKVTADVRGEILELKITINTMVDQLGSFAAEVTRVAREVGTEGRLGGQAQVRDVAGVWKDLTDNVNSMASNLTGQVRNIAAVTTAVASGDLTKKVTADVRGEILELKDTINAMVDQLNSFASEVTRVALEVGTEGKLGGQAQVKGVGGTWKDLTDSVNSMAGNLTSQVRGIAKVVTAVATGDLKRKLVVDAKGEIAELADTINEMIDTLATFADQVTTVAREVGVEGQLGGQAKVPGAAGTWKMLTENVNQLAANLTTQVRAIAEVATAVTKGDLTRSIALQAEGEMAALKDTINEMIRNLKDTTQKNTEQDWLKTNLAKFTRMLQGQKDLSTVSKLILSELATVVSAHQGVFYTVEDFEGAPVLKLASAYAYRERKELGNRFRIGEGLVGQCAFEKERILLTEVPSDYIRISSGLGQLAPLSIVVLPVLFEGDVKAVIELASFHRFNDIHLSLLDQLTETIGIVLNTIEANSRTEDLLEKSQSLADRLQGQQEELRETNTRLERQATSLQASEEMLKKQQEELTQTNEELQRKARQLSRQNEEVQAKNREIELAKLSLQERAEQLALTSKYKSEFLANMSHELRTPLNSLLILSEMLSDNNQGNLTPKQQEFASTIYASGVDLLSLINDILDMAKIESGTMAVDVGDVSVQGLADYVERTFAAVAASKGIALKVTLGESLPSTLATDGKRLQQVIRNLLSNALKFTESGEVELRIGAATEGWDLDHPMLKRAEKVIAFAVHDTGIGIDNDKLKIIFEPFQQADTGASRKFGGTGLGLSISREITRLLGGEIRVQSTVGKGSVFTLYLPSVYRAAQAIGSDIAPLSASGGMKRSTKPPERFVGDLGDINPGDQVVLIVEHDERFARVLLEKAHAAGMKGIVADDANTALTLVRKFTPRAITLDLQLPDMHGLDVLERLQSDPTTRDIPVHVISVEDKSTLAEPGRITFLQKPVSRRNLDAAFAQMASGVRQGGRVLVVEDVEFERDNLVRLIGVGGAEVTAVGTASEALESLRKDSYDCVIVDLRLPDMPGLDLVEKIRGELKQTSLPVVIYTGKDLNPQEERRLDLLTEAVVQKDAGSPNQILSEVVQFLHRIDGRTAARKEGGGGAPAANGSFDGKKILVVDDDVRNLFALTSMLERWNLDVVHAENGRTALEVVENTQGLELILMDVMMPEMDGYETTRALRRQQASKKIPIIALTAKALKGDREKCLQAGMTDYLAKPVQSHALLAMLRTHLSGREAPAPAQVEVAAAGR
jgi:signal transduction histidine kinase/CheY-like chemotaxis protein/HAMP domain-containing protein